MKKAKTYKIHLLKNDFKSYISFKNLPTQDDSLLNQVSDQSLNVNSVLEFAVSHLEIKYDNSDVFNNETLENNSEFIRNEVALVFIKNIIWINCKVF